MVNYFTDMPFVELGDIPHQPAPIRKVKLLNFDGDKWCKVEVEGIVGDIKYFYLYDSESNLMDRKSITFTDICCASYDPLS